jgi:hypothetical protein
MEIVNRILSSKKIIILTFILFSVVVSTQQLLLTKASKDKPEHEYTHYNNYIIFKQSFIHLTGNKDPYQLYPREHWDYYKYSPAFSLFFGAFAFLPDFLGLNLWNLLNALIFLLSIYYLPKIDNKPKGLILLMCLIELITSMQNSQSNGLVAGLLILSFGSLERENNLASALFIVLSVFIKLFGIIGFSLFLLYPKKWKLISYSLLWIVILGILPLIVIDFTNLKTVYTSWYHLLVNDHSTSYGLSLIGIFHSWFGIEINKMLVLIIGCILFLVPFIRVGKFRNYLYRLLILCSVLIWVVIFNHKAESPSYIIAFAGASIWYFLTKKTPLKTVLFVFAFLVTCLSPTDIIPKFLRDTFFEPYHLKAFPCILIWIYIIFEMVIFEWKGSNGKNKIVKNPSDHIILL